MALTAKQKRFVDEYITDLNATRAYKAAYPKVKRMRLQHRLEAEC